MRTSKTVPIPGYLRYICNCCHTPALFFPDVTDQASGYAFACSACKKGRMKIRSEQWTFCFRCRQMVLLDFIGSVREPESGGNEYWYQCRRCSRGIARAVPYIDV
jgi:hypothetical protein